MSHKAGNRDNVRSYNSRILKSVHPETGINSRAAQTVNNLVHSLIHRLVKSSNSLLAHSGNKTLNVREVAAATRIILPARSMLMEDVSTFAERAVTKYNTAVPKEQGSTSSADRAGLTMRPARVKRIVMTHLVTQRKSNRAIVYIAAVVERVVGEILNLAGNYARDNKKVRINLRNVMQAIRGDEELSKLFPEKSYVLGGGVLPHINTALLKGKAAEAAEATA